MGQAAVSHFDSMMNDGSIYRVQGVNTPSGDSKVPDPLKQREAANASDFDEIGNNTDVPEELADNRGDIEAARAQQAAKLNEAGENWTEAQKEYGQGEALLVNGLKAEDEATAEKSLGGADRAIDTGDRKNLEGDRDYGEAQATPIPPPTIG